MYVVAVTLCRNDLHKVTPGRLVLEARKHNSKAKDLYLDSKKAEVGKAANNGCELQELGDRHIMPSFPRAPPSKEWDGVIKNLRTG